MTCQNQNWSMQIIKNKITWYVETHNWSMRIIETKAHVMPECMIGQYKGN